MESKIDLNKWTTSTTRPPLLRTEKALAKYAEDGFGFIEYRRAVNKDLPVSLIFHLFDVYGYEYHAEVDGSVVFKKKPEDLINKFDFGGAIKGTIPPEFGSGIVNKG